MDTRLATTQIRLSRWNGIIKDRIESGLTVDDYCSQHNLSRDAYYYWLRKLKAAALNEAESRLVELEETAVPSSADFKNGGLIELKAPASIYNKPTDAFIPQLTLNTNGVTVGVNSETPPALVTRMLEVIRNA